MYYWLFMLLAIITEVIGTLSMKYGSSVTEHWVGLSIMYFMLIISYSCLAIAIKRIPLAVAYGTWESLGLAFITYFSHLLFNESLGLVKIIAISLIIIGILLMECGTASPAVKSK